MVPKGIEENLAFRKELIKLGAESRANSEELWIMCKRDPLFWINSFCYTYDPRKVECPEIPFITYPYQDRAIDEIDGILGKEDIFDEKSRDMGATWIILVLPTHRWLFFEGQSFLLISRNEDYVDKPGDRKSLFWKIDFINRYLPRWMVPDYTRRYLHLSNNDNNSSIDGESTTGNVGRGDRRTAIVLDEFAAFKRDEGYAALKSTQAATNCRIFNSTPAGIGNAFYDVSLTAIRKIRMHWSEHPEKNPGLYRGTNGILELHDKKYRFPEDYQYIMDGKIRSPWYDRECKRASHPSEIEQELDINYRSSDNPFFEADLIDEVLRRDVKQSKMCGIMDYAIDTHQPKEFIEQEGGYLKLWIDLQNGTPPLDKDYVGGIDIATGQDITSDRSISSNSVLSIAEKGTGIKVAELAVANLNPHEFAELSVVVARWFNNAFLIWEANGPGRIFGNTVYKLGYRKFFYRRSEKRVSKKITEEPGWWSDKQTKLSLLGEYRRALKYGLYTNQSEAAVQECRQIIYFANGTVGHAGSLNELSPAAFGENHSDRVIADALCWKGISPSVKETVKIQGKVEEKKETKNLRLGVRQFWHRRWKHVKEKMKKSRSWG